MAEPAITSFLRENLACPVCKAAPLITGEGDLICPTCARHFPGKDGIWYMLPDYSKEVRDNSGESIGEHYDNRSMVPGTLREIMERVTAFELLNLKGGEHLLDVGAGTLRNGLYALEKGAGIVCGIDLIPGMLKYGIAKAGKRGFADKIGSVVADACFIPFRDEAFDSVISLELVEHIPVGADMIFKEIFRVLKPGGRAAVNVWSVVTHLADRRKKNKGYYINDTFYKFYSPGEFLDLFADIDFTRKELYGHYFIPVIGHLLGKMKIPRSLGVSLAIERIVRRCSPRLSILLGRFLIVKLEK